MIAAIYARKCTEQTGVADEQKSVARQIEHARAYAAAQGLDRRRRRTSTSTTASAAPSSRNRPGFLRLMNALKPRPPFQVLIMSEESRLGREAIETAYALKQLITAGVRVFFYLEDRERTLDSADRQAADVASRRSPTSSSARRRASAPTTRCSARRRPGT